MPRFYCPECNAVAKVNPQYGTEVVSVYCLKHMRGTNDGSGLVRMDLLPTSFETQPDAQFSLVAISRLTKTPRHPIMHKQNDPCLQPEPNAKSA